MSTRQPLVVRDRFVVVIVDVQERLAAAMRRRDEVVRAASKLARSAALVGAPILVTRQNPERLGGTVGELEEVLGRLAAEGATVRVVDKTAFCCTSEDAFDAALRETGRTQVVLAGMETHICVAQAALALAFAGADVQVAADATCSRAERDHAVTLDRLRAAGVTVTVSESVMYEAVGRAATDEFRELLRIVKEAS
ncbi:MAG: isochorismatase family protein [Coriobacteriia bacterium]|nr:isochorismatase family protein [Coriobacteriia bacterium]